MNMVCSLHGDCDCRIRAVLLASAAILYLLVASTTVGVTTPTVVVLISMMLVFGTCLLLSMTKHQQVVWHLHAGAHWVT
jgi:hypothetical protein